MKKKLTNPGKIWTALVSLANIPKNWFLNTGNTPLPDSHEAPPKNEIQRYVASDPLDPKRIQADLQMLHRLRNAIQDEKSLSSIGNHVSTSITGGNITLRGLVPSEGDKALFGLKAQKIAGNDNVRNQIAVKGD